MLYQKMLLTQLAHTTLKVFVVVLLLSMGVQLPHILLRFLNMGISIHDLPLFLALFLLSYSDFLLLISLYCAVLWVLLVSFRDGDAYALFNLGIGVSHWLRLVFFFISPFLVLMSVCSLWLAPQAAHDLTQVEAYEAADHAAARLQKGVFHTFGDHQRLSFFMPHADPGAEKPPAFLHIQSVDREDVVYTKNIQLHQDQHHYVFDCDAGTLTTRFFHGRVQTAVVSFASLLFRVPLDVSRHGHVQENALSSWALWRRYQAIDQATLMTRLSPPMMLLCLVLWVVPLAYLRPRSSLFAAKLFLGIAILVVYLSAVYAIRRPIASGTVSLWSAFAIVHGTALCMMLLCIAYRTAFYRRCRHYWVHLWS